MGAASVRRGSFNSSDNPAALLLTPAAKDSHFFKSMPASVVASLQSSPIAMENHQQGTPACCELAPAPANAAQCQMVVWWQAYTILQPPAELPSG